MRALRQCRSSATEVDVADAPSASNSWVAARRETSVATICARAEASSAASLARAAYEERHLPGGELDPHRLGVLADALEEDGAPAELVAHLRGPGPHVRGCHVVDLCLGLN